MDSSHTKVPEKEANPGDSQSLDNPPINFKNEISCRLYEEEEEVIKEKV